MASLVQGHSGVDNRKNTFAPKLNWSSVTSNSSHVVRVGKNVSQLSHLSDNRKYAQAQKLGSMTSERPNRENNFGHTS